MSISITGGVHLGSNDGAPYISLHAQIGTLPTINLDIGPANSLSLTGGITAGILSPGLVTALGGNIIDQVLPPVLAPIVGGGLLSGLGAVTPLAPIISNDPHTGNTTLHLGGTVVDVPVVLTNPYILT